MTSTLLDRVPVDEITARASSVKFGRSVKRLITSVLFGVGWVTAKAFAVAWLALAFCWLALGTGWREARGNQPSRASLREENAALREQLARYGG
jgi:hypothetical protein